jgi:ElaB/YqjD/DUF883 family membrane-anchored ribosome-binding protein
MSTQYPNPNAETNGGMMKDDEARGLSQRVDEATTRAGKRVETMGRAAQDRVNQAADKLTAKTDAVGSYLQDHDVAEMADDVAEVIRRYPVQSLLVGLGVGFMIGRMTSR